MKLHFRTEIKETFDQISKYYDRVRRQPWKDLIHFIEERKFLDKCDIILDIGCGNGRHTNFVADHCNFSIGIELSIELLKIARANQKNTNMVFINSDAVHMPFREKIFSKIIYIATFHHISNQKQREQSLKELKRVLNPAGQAIITVWRRFQENFFIVFFIDFFFLTFQRRGLEFGDIFIPWRGQDKKIIANRFYHLFTMREMKRMLNKTELKILECRFFSGKSKEANIIALIEKSW